MPYRVALEIYVDEAQTWPRIRVETLPTPEAFVRDQEYGSGIDETEALENVLTETREFAQKIQSRRVEVER
jgi:hypothetical protein